ncbi:hypothetical protein DACRYDRAFT_116219 [Dacryopinax primogenitus]|uniref:Uncharacterized protein n=1 Tax=Dacryopinax primogenitus (strain DJM 731) TaxID=1858805 RepID=M5G0V0_DACPD|nr:uncharacterized protein DACRYDRAFT_116219 [Dacryopinax primogenitus]EJU01760.1 hypothetical protein DACRYDRAFT_116219 [Dacryopinax primogenitus]
MRTVKAALRFTFSKRVVPTLKGVLAYELLIILSFILGYAEISPFAQALASGVIITIASLPGQSLGACIMNIFLNLAGVLVGSLNFFIMGKLAGTPVAQGVVFAVMAYLLSLVHAQGLTYLGFSLLAILQTFTGIFTSLASPTTSFSGSQLRAYLQSYAFGCACVLVVNICLLPRTAESKLRGAIATSLDHARTLMLLVNKGYMEELTQEERVVMEQLVLSLRTDFRSLNQLLGETTFELCLSRWSMASYRSLVQKTHALQNMLIASYYGLLTGEENKSIETFKEQFLPSCEEEFRALRRSLCLMFAEIMREIAPDEFLDHQDDGGGDVEKQAAGEKLESSAEEGSEGDQQRIMEDVGCRLRQEAIKADASAARAAAPNARDSETPAGPIETLTHIPTPEGRTLVDQQLFGKRSPEDNIPHSSETVTAYASDVAKSLRVNFDAFAQKLLDFQAHLLVSGGLSVDLTNNALKLFQPMRSFADSWGTDRVRGVQEALDKKKDMMAYEIHPQTHNVAEENCPNLDEERETGGREATRWRGMVRSAEPMEDPDALRTGHALVRVYSLLYALNRMMSKVQAMHAEVTTTSRGKKRRLRLQLHILDVLRSYIPKRPSPEEAKWESDISIQEAICELEHRAYVPEQVTFGQRLLAVEKWFRSPTSVYAFKITLALCVFCVLIWAPVVRGWFISYALITALPNLILALASTLGATWLSFIIQILGTVIGNIAAMIILLIFRHVGGYLYNPYGIACLLAVYAFPLAYCVNEKPELFLFGFCGATILTVYVNTVDEAAANFNSPPFSAAIGLAALAVALGIVFCFQLLILRSPARHALRVALARLIEDHLSYVTMLQAYVRALELVDPADLPSPKVVHKVERDLKRGESDLQRRIMDMDELVAFAAAEPNWQRPFQRDAVGRVLRANQLLMDRWSETLAAIGSEPFPLWVSEQFISTLSPYRRSMFTLTKTSLFLVATSVASKIPLPIETPNPGRMTSDLVHDALLVSTRYTNTEEGRKTVKTGGFARYWFFLLANMSACAHVANIEDACREIYGTFEDKMR